jgi:serine/threonine-protein kinase HipA
VGRASRTRQLAIWMNGERVGDWSIDSQGRHELRYAERWLASSSVRPLSLSLPLRSPATPHRGERVERFFENLLPDSVEIRRRAQARFGAPGTAAGDLLPEIGRDCVGAIQLLPPDEPPAGIHSIDAEPLSEERIERILRAVAAPAALGQREEDEFRISLAGAQEKTAFLLHHGRWCRPRRATPTTHIFKLPLGRVGVMQADLSTSIENEWICARIVAAFGLAVADVERAEFGDQRVLVVKRFDRKLSTGGRWWIRLPQEDMCQALGRAPAEKYEADGGPGIDQILSLLLGSRVAREDRLSFFKAQVVFWMLCAPDGHAKNYSIFLEPGGSFARTPLYDVISAYPLLGHRTNRLPPERVRLAMAARGRTRHYRWARITGRHWRETARMCGLRSDVDALIGELVALTPRVVSRVSGELPRSFPASVAEPILDGVRRAAARL